MPSSTNEAGVSPGCTLDEMNTVGLLNLKGRFSGLPCAFGNSPSMSSSLSANIFVFAEKVTISIGLRSLL